MATQWRILFIYLFNYIDFREKGMERRTERETSICCSTFLCIHWLLPVRALTGDQTCHHGILGRCSNQLSDSARARLLVLFFPSLGKMTSVLLIRELPHPSTTLCWLNCILNSLQRCKNSKRKLQKVGGSKAKLLHPI